MNSASNLKFAALLALGCAGFASAQQPHIPDFGRMEVPESRIDINTADEELLLKLGLTSDEAKAVLKHRAKHGPLKDERELGRVRGLSRQSFEQIKGKVQFSIEASTQSA